MQRLGGFGHKILDVLVDEGDHSPLAVETPCHQLCVRSKDGVGHGLLRSTEGAAWRREVLVELPSGSVHVCNQHASRGSTHLSPASGRDIGLFT
jgi:hypothetical protein